MENDNQTENNLDFSLDFAVNWDDISKELDEVAQHINFDDPFFRTELPEFF